MVHRYGEKTLKGVRGECMTDEIKFSWNHESKGEMTVHLDQFFKDCTAAQFKKLVKCVRESEQVDEVIEQIQAYFEEFNDDYKPKQKEAANIYVALESKVNLAKRQKDELVAYIIKLKAYRKKLKRNNPQWAVIGNQLEQRNEELKEFKEELNRMKREMRDAKNDFESRKRMKDRIDRFAVLL